MLEGVFFTTIKSLEERIQSRKTGTPEELAENLKISVTLLYYCIHSMREMGAPVAYSKEESTFYFKEPGRIGERFLWKPQESTPDFTSENNNNSQQPHE